jgi:hypothetical protein
MLPYFLHFVPIWIKLGTGDVHDSSLSDLGFVKIGAVEAVLYLRA